MKSKDMIYKRKIINFVLFFGLMSLGLAFFTLSQNGYFLYDTPVSASDITPNPTKNTPILQPDTSTSPTPAASISSTQTMTLTPAPTNTVTIKPTATATPTKKPTLTPTNTPTPTPLPNDLELNKYPEINTLVEAYYKAKLTCQSQDFENVVNDMSLLDLEAFQKQYEYIKSLSNFNCYTKRGIMSIEYVVYVSYYSDIATIDTPVPSLDRILLTRDANTNELRICLTPPATSTTRYLEELQEHNDVVELRTNIQNEFQKALASDQDLMSFYLRLSQ